MARHWSEEEMMEVARERLCPMFKPEIHEKLFTLTMNFGVEVYTAFHRRYYLEALKEADLPLRLFGSGWGEDCRFSRYAGGAVGRGAESNGVYNFSRISLHLQPYASMHQRISECGLAGGFMMVNDLPAEKDWERAAKYYEPGREIVMFGSREELVDRCRYYLEHEEKRREISRNLRERALKEQTCVASAGIFLDKWRELLRNTV